MEKTNSTVGSKIIKLCEDDGYTEPGETWDWVNQMEKVNVLENHAPLKVYGGLSAFFCHRGRPPNSGDSAPLTETELALLYAYMRDCQHTQGEKFSKKLVQHEYKLGDEVFVRAGYEDVFKGHAIAQWSCTGVIVEAGNGVRKDYYGLWWTSPGLSSEKQGTVAGRQYHALRLKLRSAAGPPASEDDGDNSPQSSDPHTPDDSSNSDTESDSTAKRGFEPGDRFVQHLDGEKQSVEWFGTIMEIYSDEDDMYEVQYDEDKTETRYRVSFAEMELVQDSKYQNKARHKLNDKPPGTPAKKCKQPKGEGTPSTPASKSKSGKTHHYTKPKRQGTPSTPASISKYGRRQGFTNTNEQYEWDAALHEDADVQLGSDFDDTDVLVKKDILYSFNIIKRVNTRAPTTGIRKKQEKLFKRNFALYMKEKKEVQVYLIVTFMNVFIRMRR